MKRSPALTAVPGGAGLPAALPAIHLQRRWVLYRATWENLGTALRPGIFRVLGAF